MAIMDILAALQGAPRQQARLLKLSTVLGADTLVAERFDGWEAVDHGGFRFTVTALSADAHLSLADLLGTPALVELATAASRTALRPFHGHVVACEREGSNGGLARYRLTLAPWLSLLSLRQDSYVYRDATVLDIVEAVFSHYTQGVVVPAWRWELADRSVYAARSLTTQFQETDFAFVARLLAEEGLFYWFEHMGDAAAPLLGTHTLVLADSNAAFHADAAPAVRYHRADATERDDTIQRWEPVRRWRTGQVARASWDYRTLSLRPAGAEAEAPAVPATHEDTAGPYAWTSRAQGEARARQHLDALQVEASLVEGAGSVRTLAAGHGLTLAGHPTQDASALAVLRVEHHARNNLDATVAGQLETLLGRTALEPLSRAAFEPLSRQALEPLSRLRERGWGEGMPLVQPPSPASSSASPTSTPTDFYRNTFTALPIARSYRPHTGSGHGLRCQPKATSSGSQSAIVTGDGDPIHTDRDHRVIVQQHWQRGDNAASRQPHPRRANAPADGRAGSWARVMTPLAGANWGSALVPRVGQEVWLDYLEGDIDRPVVIASLYQGQGNLDAPYNQQAGGPGHATGNAPAWFTGNAHPGVLSGFKSQDLASSQSGGGGYRQLRFDDTAGQSHAQLATTDFASVLNLGHAKQLADNARQADLGYGVNLATAAQGAVRAGCGLLMASTSGSDPMDASPVTDVLGATSQLATGLADAAQKQQAALPGEPAPEKLPALVEQTDLATELAATAHGRPAGMGIGGGEGTASAWSKAHLVVHGAAGLVAVTPQHATLISGTDSVLGSQSDQSWIAHGQWSAVAAHGIALYTQGSPAGSRPVNETGIHLHAASGQASLQAQQDQARFAAEKAIALTTSEGSATVQAKGHLLLTAGGAYLKLQGGNIEIGGPGVAFFKGAQKELAGAMSASGEANVVKTKAEPCKLAATAADASGAALMGAG